MVTLAPHPRHDALRVDELPGKGRSIVVAEDVIAGTLLEAAPVVQLTAADRLPVDHALFDYPFAWDNPPFEEAIALGLVSLINHSDTPNATLSPDFANRTLNVFALTDIAEGT